MMRHFSLVLYRPFLFVLIRVIFYVAPLFYVFLYFSKAILLGATSKFQWGLAFIRDSILVMMMKTKRNWFHFILCSAVFLLLPSLAVGSGYPAPEKGCLSAKCHADIGSIRNRDSEMLNQIFKKGELLGDPNGCVICHGGNPFETEKKDNAHCGAPQGGTLDVYVPFPGSMWINHKTCSQCHPKHVYAMHRSVMNTEAGKIQGAMWGWGASTGYKHLYGNYDLKDLDGPVPVFGTETYSNYIQKYMKSFPDIFPLSLRQVPEANLLTLSEKPEQAIFTYIRSDCQRCHVGVRGRDKRGDFRGMGCAACHIPYSNEGLYEGTDKSIPKEKAGHLLVHTIQATRKAKVTVNGKTYSGIPHETCASCHNRGKRIGVSYQGLMEFPYGTPFNAEGGNNRNCIPSDICTYRMITTTAQKTAKKILKAGFFVRIATPPPLSMETAILQLPPLQVWISSVQTAMVLPANTRGNFPLALVMNLERNWIPTRRGGLPQLPW